MRLTRKLGGNHSQKCRLVLTYVESLDYSSSGLQQVVLLCSNAAGFAGSFVCTRPVALYQQLSVQTDPWYVSFCWLQFVWSAVRAGTP